MYTIHKYTLNTYGKTPVYVPAGAKVLDVQDQHEQLTIWFLVPQNSSAHVTRTFEVRTTGEFWTEEPGQHLATVQMQDGYFVVHVFERFL